MELVIIILSAFPNAARTGSVLLKPASRLITNFVIMTQTALLIAAKIANVSALRNATAMII